MVTMLTPYNWLWGVSFGSGKNLVMMQLSWDAVYFIRMITA